MGRVISLVTIAIFSPGFTISLSLGEPIGSRSALLTSVSSEAGASTLFGVRTPIRFSSGTVSSCFPFPYPKLNNILITT